MHTLKEERPEDFETFKMALKTDPFIRYVLTNVDTSLAATDEHIISKYFDLVEDEDVKSRFTKLFMSELGQTRRYLNDLLDRSLSERRKNHYYSNLLRSSLMNFLHDKQVSLLQDWRKKRAAGDKDVDALQVELLLTINALSGAMRNTG